WVREQRPAGGADGRSGERAGPAARAARGVGRAVRPGISLSAARHGVGVQAGGDGGGRGGAGRSTRARPLAGPGFKQAATAKEETGRGTPPERGTPRGRGSSRQQRQRKRRGGPPHPNAAPHGAGVQAGSNGRGGEAA